MSRESEIQKVKEKVAARNSTPSKEKDSKLAKAQTIQRAVANVTVENAVQKVTTAGFEIQKSLSAVSSELMTKIEELTQIEEAIKLKKAEMEELHGKDLVAMELDAILTNYETKKAELETAINTSREEWSEEQKRHTLAIVERDANLLKSRTREEQEYAYNQAQKKQADSDAWDNMIKRRNNEETERMAQLSKSWSERENALKAREQELADLKAKVEAFPAQLEKEAEKRASIVSNVLKKDHGHEIELLKKDSASNTQLLTAQLANSEAINVRQQNEIVDLKAKLTEAYTKITEVAAKATEAASGQQALAAVQAQNRNGDVRPGKA